LRPLFTLKRSPPSAGSIGLNIAKTSILTTLAPHFSDRALLEEGGFKAVKFAATATYLGVLMGQATTTVQVFDEALKKFIRRANRYQPALANSALRNRILTFNVFLLPLFYYLAQFYVIPYTEVIRAWTSNPWGISVPVVRIHLLRVFCLYCLPWCVIFCLYIHSVVLNPLFCSSACMGTRPL
jgi:hypothetical protein